MIQWGKKKIKREEEGIGCGSFIISLKTVKLFIIKNIICSKVMRQINLLQPDPL